MSWNPLTLEQARGFITGYIITYNDVSARRKREIRSVGANETSTTISNLRPERGHAISVAARTVAGVGAASEPVTVPSK